MSNGVEKIEKTFLEKRIEEKAIERFENDYRDFARFVMNHPIGKNLKVKIGDKNIPVAYFGSNYGLFNESQDKNPSGIYTNYEEVKKEIIEKYKKEETDNLIEQISGIHYLFD